jgi:hypothetical protein
MSCLPDSRLPDSRGAARCCGLKRSRFTAFTAFVAVCLAAARLGAATGQEGRALFPKEDAPLQGQRTLWAISSRHAGSAISPQPALEYWRHDPRVRGWTAAGPDEFLAEDSPGVVTLFYVHGNRINHREALYDGERVFQQVCSCTPASQPLRLVIWSWPSTQVEGPLKDVRYKACVSDAHAWHLAWLVDRMRPDVPVSLVGYSFGARLVGGTLHLLGGGRLAGHALLERVHPQRLPLRAVFMAGALDSHALLPNGRNHRALSQVERMLVLVNPRDPVLHHYPLLAGIFRKGPPALGYTGFFSRCLGGECEKIAQWNVSSYVGKNHDWQRYLYSPAIVSRLQRLALFAE